MNSPRLLDLAQRQGALRARIAAQRTRLAEDSAPVAALCAGGDRVLAGVAWLRSHPLEAGLGLAVFMILRPRRTWRLGRRAFLLWRGWLAVRRLLAHPAAARFFR